MVRSESSIKYLPAFDRLIAGGIDIAGALAVAEKLDYDVEAVADLIGAAESGLVTGLNKQNG